MTSLCPHFRSINDIITLNVTFCCMTSLLAEKLNCQIETHFRSRNEIFKPEVPSQRHFRHESNIVKRHVTPHKFCLFVHGIMVNAVSLSNLRIMKQNGDSVQTLCDRLQIYLFKFHRKCSQRKEQTNKRTHGITFVTITKRANIAVAPAKRSFASLEHRRDPLGKGPVRCLASIPSVADPLPFRLWFLLFVIFPFAPFLFVFSSIVPSLDDKNPSYEMSLPNITSILMGELLRLPRVESVSPAEVAEPDSLDLPHPIARIIGFQWRFRAH